MQLGTTQMMMWWSISNWALMAITNCCDREGNYLYSSAWLSRCWWCWWRSSTWRRWWRDWRRRPRSPPWSASTTHQAGSRRCPAPWWQAGPGAGGAGCSRGRSFCQTDNVILFSDVHKPWAIWVKVRGDSTTNAISKWEGDWNRAANQNYEFAEVLTFTKLCTCCISTANNYLLLSALANCSWQWLDAFICVGLDFVYLYSR